MFSCVVRQGEALGRPGQVEVEVEVEVEVAINPTTLAPCAVRIGGNAVIAFRTEMEI